ncbi:MAG: adenylate/guanylate cyclase domain-containing protein [Alphaproteobacteria bacterium]|nr:adenylate/guanylate cyclase domain-containing protein [Alphaproteobacteria bacterium]
MAPERVERRLAAILAADVVGYSRLMETDEAGTLARLKEFRAELIDPQVVQYRGRIVKLMGDGMLAEFGSVVDAVQCAVEVQSALADRNAADSGPERMVLRIGVHLGDVIVEGADLYGDGINIAARLEGLAEPGGVAISGLVHESVAGKLDHAFVDGGDHAVKNIARPVRVWRWSPDTGQSTAGHVAPAERRVLPDRPSIAVLPFRNLSGDPEQEYFSDGISEDVIIDLSKISGLFVIARNSSFAYKDTSPNVQQVSRELGVRYVLEGSVRKAADRVRISAELIDGTTGGHIWAERYDRALTDIFAVQDEVTGEIVGALKVSLTKGEHRRSERKGTGNLEAYDWFLRGRERAWRTDKEEAARAVAMFERATELDPGFAAAYSMLSLVSTLEYINRWSEAPERSAERSRELAQKALELDDSDPLPHIAMSLVFMWGKQLERAIAEAQRALDLDPNSALAYSVHASALHYAGNSHEALERIETAMRLDPHYPDLWLHFLGQIYFMLERYDEAASALQRRLVRKPESDISRVLLAACFGHLGRIAEARAEWSRVLEINPDYSLDRRLRILPYADRADLDRMVLGLRKAGVPA